MDLPNRYGTDYVVRVRYTKWERDDHTRIEAVVPLFHNVLYAWTPWFVETWGSRTILLPNMREVTLEYFVTYPSLFDFAPAHVRPALTRQVASLQRRMKLSRK